MASAIVSFVIAAFYGTGRVVSGRLRVDGAIPHRAVAHPSSGVVWRRRRRRARHLAHERERRAARRRGLPQGQEAMIGGLLFGARPLAHRHAGRTGHPCRDRRPHRSHRLDVEGRARRA